MRCYCFFPFINKMEPPKDLFRPYTNQTCFFSFDGEKRWARVVSCYDADTMTIVMEIQGKYYKYNIRLIGIDTCEMKSKNKENKERAVKARNRVLQWLGLNIELTTEYTRNQIQKLLTEDVYLVWIHCGSFDKYGRLLASVYLAPHDTVSCADMLLEERYAYSYQGGTKLTEEEQNNFM